MLHTVLHLQLPIFHFLAKNNHRYTEGLTLFCLNGCHGNISYHHGHQCTPIHSCIIASKGTVFPCQPPAQAQQHESNFTHIMTFFALFQSDMTNADNNSQEERPYHLSTTYLLHLCPPLPSMLQPRKSTVCQGCKEHSHW